MLEHFCAAIGQLMRIKGTSGQPVGVRGFLQACLSLYAFILPPTWAYRMGWLLPLMTLIVFLLMFGLADLAVRLETPFGDDVTALDMKRFALLIQKNVEAIKQRSGRPRATATLPSGEGDEAMGEASLFGVGALRI